MARFSGGEAIGAGFRVIARHPGALLVWALAYLVIGILPRVAGLGLVGPDFLEIFRQAATNPGATGDESFAHMLRVQSHMMAYNGLSMLSTLVIHALLAGAVFRAVLDEKDSGFGYLRLGVQEFWLAVVSIAFWILLFMVMFAALIPLIIAGVVIGISAGHDSSGVGLGVLAIIGLGLAFMALILWLCVRFSMALPMTYARRQFMLFESWSLTRGQAWPMFGVALALVAIIIVFELIILALVFATIGGTLISHASDLEALFKRPPEIWMPQVAPWLVGYCGIVSLFGAALYAIMLAPWASIYRDLTAAPPAVADFGAP